MTEITVQTIGSRQSNWGEGPIWWQNKLVYVDIEGHTLVELDPETGEETIYEIGERIGTVVPRASGGVTSWQNVVAACSPCNLKKGGKSCKDADMFPKQKPYIPTVYDLHNNGRKFPPNHLHESWMDFLYWDTELEP